VTRATRVLVIDSYDSFVYNLVQYLGELGADPLVHRNDAITVDEAIDLAPDAVLLSPGPGRPEDAGIICDAIGAFAAQGTPVFGVCLGLQAIGYV
jgi:anthranilate/para-aminobenzoate synthase component II